MKYSGISTTVVEVTLRTPIDTPCDDKDVPGPQYRSSTLLALVSKVLLLLSLYPSCPPRIDQVFLDHQISHTQHSGNPSLQRPIDPSSSSQICREAEPNKCKGGTGCHTDQDLFRRMIAEVYPAGGYSSSTSQSD